MSETRESFQATDACTERYRLLVVRYQERHSTSRVPFEVIGRLWMRAARQTGDRESLREMRQSRRRNRRVLFKARFGL